MPPHFCQVLLLAVAVLWWWHKCCGGVVCRSSAGAHLQPATSRPVLVRTSAGPHLAPKPRTTTHLYTQLTVSLLSSAQLMCRHFPGPQPFVCAEDAGDDWAQSSRVTWRWLRVGTREWGRGRSDCWRPEQWRWWHSPCSACCCPAWARLVIMMGHRSGNHYSITHSIVLISSAILDERLNYFGLNLVSELDT